MGKGKNRSARTWREGGEAAWGASLEGSCEQRGRGVWQGADRREIPVEQKGRRGRGPGCCTHSRIWGLGVMVPFLKLGAENTGDQE